MAKFLTILLAEASIEPFPEELMKDINVRNYFSKLKKTPSEVMLDANYHKHLTKNLPDIEKRGRPDIVHIALLSCFGSILAREHRLRVIIHTINDEIIYVDSEIRLPKNIDRFNGLILQLFRDKKVPPSGEETLMSLQQGNLLDLIKRLRKEHDLILEFSVKGEQLSPSEYSEIIFNATNPLLIFGAFPHGELTPIPSELVDKTLGIYEEGLDLFAVISQILASQHMLEENKMLNKSTQTERVSWE
jgi:rRNA small subunit pseudouridine methyltransferase Nep1